LLFRYVSEVRVRSDGISTGAGVGTTVSVIGVGDTVADGTGMTVTGMGDCGGSVIGVLVAVAEVATTVPMVGTAVADGVSVASGDGVLAATVIAASEGTGVAVSLGETAVADCDGGVVVVAGGEAGVVLLGNTVAAVCGESANPGAPLALLWSPGTRGAFQFGNASPRRRSYPADRNSRRRRDLTPRDGLEQG
jgi:hypothetical protein